MTHEVDRLLTLVCRELGAREAVVIEAGDDAEAAGAQRELRCAFGRERTLVARFDRVPVDRAALQRRLEMLASTFEAVTDGPGRAAEAGAGNEGDRRREAVRSRPPIARALQEELRRLCARAAAVNAIVIDANSPVVWGAAEPGGLGEEWPLATALGTPESAAAPATEEPNGPLVHELPADGFGEDLVTETVEPSRAAAPSRAALEQIKNLPAMAALSRGRHLRHVELGGAAPLLAHSFAGIYCLVLVYADSFDELRAERAVVEALVKIEPLVLALPPLDPTPQAGAGALFVMPRRARRR